MMSLFNSFDLYFFYSSFIVLVFFMVNFFNKVLKLSIFSVFFNKMDSSLNEFFYSLKAKSFNKFVLILLMSIFTLLFAINFSSVFSFNFPYCSQISVVMLLGLSIWSSFVLFTFFNSYKGFLSHCIPEGTPIYLTWFLFAIELVSNSIRPLTVTVRLVANILAGHLLLILLSKLVMLNLSFMILYIGLNLVEFFVSLIQSYIFVTMICLYYSDVN